MLCYFFLFFFFFFFFSSRRRHTRSLCDWSSDVCSSDLPRMRLLGVEAVGAATTLPLSNRMRGGSVRRVDKPASNDYSVRDDFVSGDYFSALQIRLLQGRAITEADNLPTAPRVLVIDAKIARDLYPDEDPLGKTLNYADQPWEIVGIAAPIRHAGLNFDPDPRIYGPRAHFSY